MSKRVNRVLILCFGSVLISLSSFASGGDFERGKMLYENQCQGCHESVVHIESRRTVDSLHKLRQQVVRWSDEVETKWGKEDIADVLEYLNKQHYQLEDEHT